MAVAAGLLAVGVTGSIAGPEKVKFPADYLKGTLYATVDRPDTKQYRELYASPGVVEAVRAGKPVPSGAVLTLVQCVSHQGAAALCMIRDTRDLNSWRGGEQLTQLAHPITSRLGRSNPRAPKVVKQIETLQFDFVVQRRATWSAS